MQVDKIKLEPAKEGKATGQQVCIPCILSKVSQDGVAPDSVPVKCYHFLVHPATVTTCKGKPALLEFLVTVVGMCCSTIVDMASPVATPTSWQNGG